VGDQLAQGSQRRPGDERFVRQADPGAALVEHPRWDHQAALKLFARQATQQGAACLRSSSGQGADDPKNHDLSARECVPRVVDHARAQVSPEIIVSCR